VKSKVLVSVLLAGLLSSPTWAGTLTVGVEGHDYMPISNGEGGNYAGYAREVLDTFAAKYGHTFTYKPMPVSRLWDEYLVKKSVDLKFPDNGYWNSDAKKGINISYSKGVVSVTEGLLVVPANKGKVASVSKIATLRGFTPFPYLDQIKSGKVAVTEVNAAEAAINMATAGRVDGVYLGTLAANYIMSERMKAPGVLVYDDKLPNSANDFTLSSFSHPEVVKQMDEFLLKEKDTVTKLKAKHKIVE